MDPTEALRNGLTACLEGDRESAIDAFEALAVWLDREGFFPDVDSAILSLPTVAD